MQPLDVGIVTIVTNIVLEKDSNENTALRRLQCRFEQPVYGLKRRLFHSFPAPASNNRCRETTIIMSTIIVITNSASGLIVRPLGRSPTASGTRQVKLRGPSMAPGPAAWPRLNLNIQVISHPRAHIQPVTL